MDFDLITPAEQARELDQHNQHIASRRQIPNVLRNRHTGWPMLQVSLFELRGYAPVTREAMYGPTIQGDKYKFLHMAAHSLAELLSSRGDLTHSIPANLQHCVTRPTNSFDSFFMRRFKTNYAHDTITINEEPAGYGTRKLTVSIQGVCDDAIREFETQLADLPEQVLQGAHGICSFSESQTPIVFSEGNIIEALDDSLATFYQGQIYVDLGVFLDTYVQTKEIRDAFELAFQVEAYNRLPEPGTELSY